MTVRFRYRRAPWSALSLLPILAAADLAAQRANESVRAVAGPEYHAGGLHRMLLGGGYRELWTAPVMVPVLDPDTFAGGLEVEKEGGGLSTESLRLKGRNGREYVFRSVDKNVTPALPKDLRGTLPHSIVQDLVSAKQPASALVVPPLLEAAGVLHATARYYVMPDHPFLGEQRQQFRGRLGMLEERPTDGFAGSRDVQGSDDFRKKIEESPEDRIDAHAYLTARLMDVFFGDWDRHWDQWRWARFDSGGVHWWKPIPRDRDNTFNDNRGLLTGLARSMTPILVHFGPEYDQVLRYHVHPAELDRLLLSPLPRAAWDSTANALRARLTDAVIDAAVRRMPPEYVRIEGEELAAALKARRDALPAAAAEVYAIVAREVDVHTTDAAERAEVVRLADGGVEVSVRAASGGAPFYLRRFDPAETREVRLYLHGGDDQALVRGASEGDAILVRVIGGGGDDSMGDQSTAPGGRRTVFYDDRGHNSFDPRGEAKVDEHPWEAPKPNTLLGNAPPVRDWGSSSSLTGIYANWELNIGPVVGIGPNWKRYGFRRAPHAEMASLRLLWAPLEHNGFGAQSRYERYVTNRPALFWVQARGSNFEDVRFHGFGNQSPGEPDRDVFEVDQTQVRGQIAYEVRPARGLRVWAGPAAKWTDPGTVNAPRGPLLGDETFWQAGAEGGVALDRRDTVAYPRHGFRVEATGSGWGSDLVGPFGRAEGFVSGYASVPGAFGPTVALRLGGQWATGDYPFQESAFVGGPMNLRGYRYQRFRGDAALFGSAELRAQLAYVNLGVARFHLGAFGLADAGRVYLGGESPGGWHTSTGGGLSFRTLGRSFTAAYAKGERGMFYATVGMPF
ncbi:MAG TPA: BamA/TamA family outer membrane protein [Longimicrobiaceae bacterium]|nr:BamA/TamA family outer membrane protein [Longimicrobiaceae bacterium]